MTIVHDIVKKKNYVPGLIVAVCCVISIGLSIMESRLNIDVHHWGLMYSNAADLNKGMTPYTDIYIQYGVLTTLIHSLSLKVFGDTIVSIGVMTGIFYAASIYLSYCLWQKICSKWLACISAILMFLIHPYIAFPWPNYLSYTFLLISLLILTRSSESGGGYFFAGIFLMLSFFARETTFLPVLTSIYLYFCVRYFSSERDLRVSQIKHIATFHVGMLALAVIFLIWFLKDSALTNWVTQNFRIIAYNLDSPRTLYNMTLRFGYCLATALPTSEVRDLRVWIFTLAFFCELVIAGRIFLSFFRSRIGEKEITLFLFASVALFGYSQAFQRYDIFRLVNSSGLGIGLLVFLSYNGLKIFKGWGRAIFGISVICLTAYLAVTIFVIETPSHFRSWRKDLSSYKQLGAPEGVGILKWKLYDIPTKTYYEDIRRVMDNYGTRLRYLVNFTRDCCIPSLVRAYKRAQKSPFYDRYAWQKVFPEEKDRVTRLLAEGEAILVTSCVEDIPENYQIVREYTLQFIYDGTQYVSVPKRLCVNDNAGRR